MCGIHALDRGSDFLNEFRNSFYVRPSKAIERGGGFYVPGLEGYRLRLFISLLIMFLMAANRLLLPGYHPLESQILSEGITLTSAFALLLSALMDATSIATGGTSNDIGASEGNAKLSQSIFLTPSLNFEEDKVISPILIAANTDRI